MGMRVSRLAPDAMTAVSSAKSRVNSQVARWRSLIKQRNRMGPNMLPCSTEMSIVSSGDLQPLTSVNCDLPDK